MTPAEVITIRDKPMGENSSMADIIPAGERGSFTITAAELMHSHPITLGAFEALVLNEAEDRGLIVSVGENWDQSVTVQWEPLLK